MTISVVAVLRDLDRYRWALDRHRFSIAKGGSDLPELRDRQRTPCAS
ncbi:hypothetical protein [Sphingomonas sp. PAMC 26605]|nr:hypothetical protein [Sphingomonas sp. PAMC 26605]